MDRTRTRLTRAQDHVQQALRELLNAVSFNQGDLTTVQLRYILSCHDVSHWATALRVIFSESEPRIVSNEVATALTATLSALQDSDETDEISKVIGGALDQLPRSQLVALGEFCALLRDTGGPDTQQLACLVGPMLLAPRMGPVTTVVTSASAAVMEFLIEEAESVFGRVACYPGTKDALGVRRAPPNVRRASRQMLGGAGAGAASGSALLSPRGGGGAPPFSPGGRGGNGSNLGMAPPPGLGGFVAGSDAGTSPGSSVMSQPPTESEIAAAKTNKRKNQLRAFFEFRANDRVKDLSDCVNALFDNYDFEDIAKGIWERFNLLPPGWQFDLAEVRNAGSAKLDWFSESQVGVQKAPNAKGRPVSFVPPAVPKPGPPEKRAKADLIIDEIIDTEQTYRESLEELLQSYLSQVRDICQGRKGPEAAEALGLSAKEVEAIFGWRIGEITKVSAALQKKLEVVSLVRGAPRSKLGRRGLVAQAFIEIADELHVYAPYVSAHKTSLQTLDKALAALSAKDKKGGGGVGALGGALLGGNRKDKDMVNFLKLWEAVSSSSPRLRGQTIQSLLIMPVQRVPRYKLLLNELLKGTEKDDPAHPLLQQALELVEVSAKQINEALRQHEKLNKIFGDELIGPAASDGQGKGGRILLSYIDA